MTDVLRLALVCLRVGTFVFGGGLVMVPLLRADVVDKYHWLTEREFVDAVALGQMTPGPLLVTATFVGYEMAGVGAALLATLCMFLPSFLMTIAVSSRLERLQDNAYVQRFLWGVRAAVVGLVVSAAVDIGRSSCSELAPALLGIGGLDLLVSGKVGSGSVVIASGLIGLAVWGGVIPHLFGGAG